MTSYVWNNPASGDWEDPGNWSPFTGSFPQTGDSATIKGVATTQINVPTFEEVADLSMRNANATLNVFGAGGLGVDIGLTLERGHIAVFDNSSFDIFALANLNGGSLSAGGPDGAGTIFVQDIVREIGTQVTLGRGGEIDISDGIWNIQSNDGIRQTGPSEILIEGVGTLEKTGGTGTSRIAGHIDDNDHIKVGVGKLEFQFNVDGSGDAILRNSSQLQFDREVSIPTVDFTGSNETLHLQQPQNFFAQIDGFRLGDAVKLLGNWHFDSITHSGGITDLTLNRNSTFHTFEFGGNLALHVASGAITTITV